MSGAPRPPDPVLEALDELMRVGRANMAAWVALMDRVELVREARANGQRYVDMAFENQGAARIIDVVASNQERLAVAAARFRRVMAHQLQDEGMSVAAIGRAFGVSRQRVSNLLGESRSAAMGIDDAAPAISGQTGPSGAGRAEAQPKG